MLTSISLTVLSFSSWLGFLTYVEEVATVFWAEVAWAAAGVVTDIMGGMWMKR